MKLSRRRTNCMKASILVGFCVCITGCTNIDYIECWMNDERQKLTDVEIRSISDSDIVQNKVLQNGYIMLQWCDVKDVHMFDNNVEHLKDRKVSYNSFTQWSPEMKEELASVEAYGMDPGLGIRNLHEQGITGKGVSIAIIDQPFDPNHIEYEGKIREYEIYNTDSKGISMHGPAVTSIAVGENCGVAPDAEVYYIGQSFSDKNGEANLKDIAKSIDHILEKNDHLENPVRAISISIGFMLGDNIEGTQEWYDAIERARKKGVLVATCSMAQNYRYCLDGLTRDLRSDPNEMSSWTQKNDLRGNVILVPEDARYFAGYGSSDDYCFFSVGGASWLPPWLVGLYALCLQVDPDLDSETFLKYTYDTGYSNGKSMQKIADPQKLIEYIKTI